MKGGFETRPYVARKGRGDCYDEEIPRHRFAALGMTFG